MPRVGRSHALAAALLTGLTVGCDRPPAERPDGPQHADAELLLEVDGLRLERSEFAALEAYLLELDPKLGRKQRQRALLEQHFLPLLLARRAFADERAAQRERAEALAAVSGNSLELERKGAVAGGFRTEAPLYRSDLPMPVVAWAFRPERVGAVSPVIETPRGFTLISPTDYEPGLTQTRDRIRAVVVPFPTHETNEFDRWLGAAIERLRGRTTYLHPDLEGALPAWLQD